MELGYNTFDIFTSLSPDKRKQIKELAGDLLYRYPGGARAAADYSFNKSYSLEKENPFAYVCEFEDFTYKGVVVCNINAHLQFKNSVWFSRNMRLMDCIPKYIELGNEVYADKTITGFRTVRNLEKSAKIYCDLCDEYISLLLDWGFNMQRIGVVLAPEENNAYKAWNKVVRAHFGDNVAYIHHVYISPSNISYTNVLAIVNKRFGKYDKTMWVTEASWQFKSGVKVDMAKVGTFHETLKNVLSDIGVKMLLWWRLGGNDTNKYNHFKV